VRWRRPPRHEAPAWMSDAQSDALPQWLEVRELRYVLPRRGRSPLTNSVYVTSMAAR